MFKSASANPYLNQSVEDLQLLLSSSSNPETKAKCQEALAMKNKPKAFVTVELLRNTRAKAVGDSFRIQGKLVKAYTENYNGELTFGFGDYQGTAKIGIFLMVPQYVMSDLSFAQGQHATFEVAFSQHPVTNSTYVLQAGEIPTLKKHPESGDTLPVWKKGRAEVIATDCPDGYVRAMSPVYSEVKVEDLVDCVTVNLATVNAVVPADPIAWIKASNEYQQQVDAHNLKQWTESRQSSNALVNDALKDVMLIDAKEEAEVKI